MKKYLLLLVLLLPQVLLPGCSDKNSPTRPVACFTYAPESPVAMGDNVVFTNCSQHADLFHWDFGDLMTSTEQNPGHIYTKTGEFNVQLIAINSAGNAGNGTAYDTITQKVTVVVWAKK
jgi:PKD repeat protein